jgi:hypothetical protein
MTHDIQYEYNISQRAFSAGYSQGVSDEYDHFTECLIKMSDDELINFVHDIRERKDALLKMIKAVKWDE